MSFNFSCPNCKQQLEAEEDWIGQSTDCPICGKTITIKKGPTLKVVAGDNSNNKIPEEKDKITGSTKDIGGWAKAIFKEINNLLNHLSESIGKKINTRFKKNYNPKICGYIFLATCSVVIIIIIGSLMHHKREPEQILSENGINPIGFDFNESRKQLDDFNEWSKEQVRRAEEASVKRENEHKNANLFSLAKENKYDELHKVLNDKTLTIIPSSVNQALLGCIEAKEVDIRIVKELLQNISEDDARKYSNPSFEFPESVLYKALENNKLEIAELLIKHGGFEIDNMRIGRINLNQAFLKKDNDYILNNSVLEYLLKLNPEMEIGDNVIISLLKHKQNEMFKKLLPNCKRVYDNGKWKGSTQFSKDVLETSPEMYLYIASLGAKIDDNVLMDLYKNNKNDFLKIVTNADAIKIGTSSKVFYEIITNDDLQSFSSLLKSKKIDAKSVNIDWHFTESPKCLALYFDYCKSSKVDISKIDLLRFIDAEQSFAIIIDFYRNNNLVIDERIARSIIDNLLKKENKDKLIKMSNENFVYITDNAKYSNGIGIFNNVVEVDFEKAKGIYKTLGIKSTTFESLQKATQSGNLDAVKFVVEHGASINPKEASVYYEAPLTYAVKSGNIQVVKYLVENGASVNYSKDALNALGRGDAVSAAIATDQPEILDYLLNKGGILFYNNKQLSDIDYLREFISYNHPKIISYLFSKKQYSKYLTDPIIFAEFCYKGNLDYVQKALNLGADVNASNGYNPIISAISGNHMNVVKLLVEKGSNVNYNIDNYKIERKEMIIHQNIPPIIVAILNKNIEMIQFILGHGVKLQNYKNWPIWNLMFNTNFNSNAYLSVSPLKIPSQKQIDNETTIIKYLIENGLNCKESPAFISAQAGGMDRLSDLTPLDYFASRDSMDFVSLILQHDKQIPGKTKSLYYAIKNNNEDMMELIYKSGLNINEKLPVGATYNDVLFQTSPGGYSYLLIYSISHSSSPNAIKWLINHKVNIDLQDSDGNTALHKSVLTKDVAIIQLLLNSGANRNIKNQKGEIPIDLTKDPQIKQMLSN